MPIRRLPSDDEAEAEGFRGPETQRRRDVLRETLRAFEDCDPPDRYHRLAASNLLSWRAQARSPDPGLQVYVLPGDWGDVTQALTRTFGTCFAVLNMANAFFPGGAYAEGAVAQEENMFRRTDCHFRIREEDLDDSGRMYTPEMSLLLSADRGRVLQGRNCPAHKPLLSCCFRNLRSRLRPGQFSTLQGRVRDCGLTLRCNR
jgi:hypothetical protein